MNSDYDAGGDQLRQQPNKRGGEAEGCQKLFETRDESQRASSSVALFEESGAQKSSFRTIQKSGIWIGGKRQAI